MTQSTAPPETRINQSFYDPPFDQHQQSQPQLQERPPLNNKYNAIARKNMKRSLQSLCTKKVKKTSPLKSTANSNHHVNSSNNNNTTTSTSARNHSPNNNRNNITSANHASSPSSSSMSPNGTTTKIQFSPSSSKQNSITTGNHQIPTGAPSNGNPINDTNNTTVDSASSCAVCGRNSQRTTFQLKKKMKQHQIEIYKTQIPNCRASIVAGNLVCDRCYRVVRPTLQNQESLKVTHPQASFMDSICGNKPASYWVNQYPNVFSLVDRVDYCNVTSEMIDEYMFVKKEPLVLSNVLDVFVKKWLSDTKSKEEREQVARDVVSHFSFDYLRTDAVKNIYHKPRDNDTFSDADDMSLNDYMKYLDTPKSSRVKKNLYGKDIPCPDEWKRFVFENQALLPRFVYKGKGDLLAELPVEMRAISLMVYIGDHGTFTPCHQDLCGSLGHNLMVCADGNDNGTIKRAATLSDEELDARINEMKNRGFYKQSDEIPSTEAYSMWCIFKPNQLSEIKQFWKEHNGWMEADNFFIPLKVLSESNLTTILVEQRVGDLVLLPPLAPHQVANENGRTAKVAWNTLSCKSIGDSYRCLEDYRAFGKAQIYRIKAVAYYTLKNRIEALEKGELSITQQSLDEILMLLKVVADMYNQDWIDNAVYDPKIHAVKYINDKEGSHTRVCNVCACDIWNRWYHCDLCRDTTEDGVDCCLDCYASGRGCSHLASMQLCQHIPMSDIKQTIDTAKEKYITGKVNLSGLETKLVESELDTQLSQNNSDDKVSVSTAAVLLKQKHNLNENSYCHQCKKQHQVAHTIKCCSCDLWYCEQCLHDRYAVPIHAKMRLKAGFKCPKCDNICNCAPCLQNRGLTVEDYDLAVSRQLKQIDVPYVAKCLLDSKEGHKFSISDTKTPGILSQTGVKRKSDISVKSEFETASKKSKIGSSRNDLSKLQTPKSSKTLRNSLSCCHTCRETIPPKTTLRQSAEHRNQFYCGKCTPPNDTEIIEHHLICDKCHNTAVGVTFSARGSNFCHKCVSMHSTKELFPGDQIDAIHYTVHFPVLPGVSFGPTLEVKQEEQQTVVPVPNDQLLPGI